MCCCTCVPAGGHQRVRRTKLVLAQLACVFFLGLYTAPVWAATSISGGSGLTVSVDPNGGYDIAVPAFAWSFHGNIGATLANIAVASGTDRVGGYAEIGFDFQTDAARHAAIRAYSNHQAVLFTASSSAAAPNSFLFPNWTQYPRNFQHLTFSGAFAPPSFTNFASDSPWVFFDSAADTFIVSPATYFMVANTAWGPNGELTSGISPQITTLPAGLQQQTLLVIEQGINHAFRTWGVALTALHGKKRPTNDADLTLNKLGYWTDNGASYYYRTAPTLSYEQTLERIKSDFDQAGIGLGYLQLDSWFYPKGANADWTDNNSGIFQYLASPALFPTGLSSFQQSLKVPLVTHSRWIDPSSPYHGQYQMSGDVVVDQNYWNATAAYLAHSGAVVYEQDWLGDKARTAFDLPDPVAFLDNMATAMAGQNITVQYCMAAARHFLHSTFIDNVTTVRVSEDRFGPNRWTNSLYASRLASALGLWPFTDNLKSSETENLLLATLSAGPVGIGDSIGSLNAANLLQAVRQDGVIVKPDYPLTPMDSTTLNLAQGVDAPLVAATYSDFGNSRTYYIVTYPTGSNSQASINPAEVGLSGPTYYYDYFSGTGRAGNATNMLTQSMDTSLAYLIAAHIGPSGMALVGDTGQFATMGKKRIPSMTDDGSIHVTVAFAAGEKSRTLKGYAPFPPEVHTSGGASGVMHYDAQTRQFTIAVSPGADGTASLIIHRANLHAPEAPIRQHLPSTGAL